MLRKPRPGTWRRLPPAVVAAIFWLQQPGGAALAQPLAVQESTLENGLKVLLLEDRRTPLITFQVWYRVGSRDEADGKSGLSHFLEHVIGPQDYSRIIARNGGDSNAYTSSDATVYYATMSRDKIDVAIAMEAARMAEVLLDGAEFESEKKVVLEERRRGVEDQPIAELAELASAVTYLVHPYRRPVIGWTADIQGLTREDLAAHHRTYYVPNNAFVVAVGDFSAPEMLAKIEAAFGKIPRRADPPRAVAREAPQRGERRLVLKREAELPFLLFNYHVPNVRHPDSYALDVLATVLAGGRSSRLHRELVYEKRLVRGVNATYYGLAVDSTLLAISMQLMPGQDPEEVERAVDALLERVKAEPLSDIELQRAKNQIEASFVFNQDGLFRRATTIGYFESAAGWQLANRYVENVKRVTAADVLRAARQYLDPDRRTVATLIPARNGR
jgi:zinc protease